jgi:hypothetical protein
MRSEIERRMNIDNFDSGPGVEDIFREELSRILPTRYSVRSGVVSDSTGNTAGDCDVVVFNDIWFPSIKAGATEGSRRWHYPIEGTYGVLEIKQSLSAASLDDAMAKLVACSRLEANRTHDRIVENRGVYLNEDSPPMFTAIVATGLAHGYSRDDLVQRFVALNGMVERRAVVNALCVLGDFFVTWGIDDGEGRLPRTTYFIGDELNEEIFPLYARQSGICALYELVTVLLGHLHGMVLMAEDIAVHYGAPQKASRPELDLWNLLPDRLKHLRP